MSAFDVGDYELGKTRLLSRECRTCIFRPASPVTRGLNPGRLKELLDEARGNGTFVVCHSTFPGLYPGAKPAVCRGFYDRFKTAALQVIERLWGFVEVDPPGEEMAAVQGGETVAGPGVEPGGPPL